MQSPVLSFALPSIVLGTFVFITASSQQSTEADNSVDPTELLELCSDCHDDLVIQFANSAHGHSSAAAGESLSCIGCHASNAAEHADDPYNTLIETPAKSSAATQRRECGTCHQPHLHLDNLGVDPHTDQGLACLDCHAIHTRTPSLLIENSSQMCGTCHLPVLKKFAQRSSHPVIDSKTGCLECHDFTGRKEPLLGHGQNANCRQCHSQQSGPFPHAHMAASSYAGGTQDGCLSCHDPHGSSNDRLLKRAGKDLCRQCHATPSAHRTAHSGEGVMYDCMECHSDIHGSFESRNLLHPRLGEMITGTPGSCFCHGVTQ